MGRWVYSAMRFHCERFLIQTTAPSPNLLNLEPRNACYWKNRLWSLYRADQLRHPYISVRNRASSYSRTYHLVDAVVDYLGNHGPIFRSIWLLVHFRRGVFPDTMGYPDDSGNCTKRRDVIFP